MDMDVAFQLKLKSFQKRFPHLVQARLMGGSGLQMSGLLRWYFREYLNRLFTYGPESFPCSFNVVEAFLSFNRQYMFFDLRDEVEHLLSINEYYSWYKRRDIPMEPSILQAIMTEGRIYSYDLVSEAGSVRISAESQQVFAGVSLVRHAHELSCVLLAGENPARHSDEEILQSQTEWEPAPGRGDIKVAEELTVKDRYLDGYPGFAKVIVLSRFDLRSAKHDVRYVCLDEGRAFMVLTDDLSVLREVPSDVAEKARDMSLAELGRYRDLFGALASMIFLPAFFAVHADNVRPCDVATALQAMREDKEAQQTIKALGESACVFTRTVHCMPVAVSPDEGVAIQILPPDMQFKCDGYWKVIGPLEMGQDREGHRIVGRTRVAQHESWSAEGPRTFMVGRRRDDMRGSDPGVIYVQRSPAHDWNLYKIGLTRRTPEERAAELSEATGVPLPFCVVASWKVGDCAGVEREIHQRLAPFRVNERREFFAADLRVIVGTIDAIIQELGKGDVARVS